MNQRFSAQFLRVLRNDIPIDILITDVLQYPHKFTDNYLRFLCPHCSEFRTATNRKTNLARCFLCEVNFNTIDFTITTQNLSFTKAVYFLQQHFILKS